MEGVYNGPFFRVIMAHESIDERERDILRFWKERDIFRKSLKIREKEKRFSFYDGPPFATGLPHYGHLLAGTIKDVVPRYKTMKGFYVERRFGWDCHGLPIEQEIEKAFDLSGAPSIEAFGIGRFNEECRKIVLRYAEQWKGTVERMGRWVDFDATWHTMDITFMESVWWVFHTLFDKGLIYEGYKVMPYSAKLGTPLSNFEAADNYKLVDDPSIIVTLPLVEESDTALLVWTTTPWTLVSNMGAALNREMEYVKVELPDHRKVILAKAALERLLKDKEYRVVETFKGETLLGKRYTPPFAHFAHLEHKGAFRIIPADFVSLEEGTGIVHMAPAFGEEDFFACKKEGVPLVCPVDGNGHFSAEIPEYKGLFVKEADKAIIAALKGAKRLFYQGTISHRYPFCWRSDTPLIYKAVTTLFVNVEKLKERLVAANATVHWMPAHLREGRFGKWLEGARDWAISRNRFWGTPIPIWKSEDGSLLVVGSIAQLEALTGKKITDIHRHFIDDLVIEKEGKTYRRISEVFDCWFDAGSMPYGQNHYPFDNKDVTENTFPADFVAEGIDQTRGWFYTLTVLAVALFDQPAFKNVVVNGIILAADGTKMSKRLKNYPEPGIVLAQYGADAVRLYMLNSPAVKADDLRFSTHGVELVLRSVLIPLTNSLSFFLTYAKIYHWKGEKKSAKKQAVLDLWILSKLQRLIHDVESSMNDYDLAAAVEPFVGFVDDLTNWYIRRSRRRFWADEETQDRNDAFETLYTVLFTLSKIAAPFIPFLSESIYQELHREGMPESVHLCDFPLYEQICRDTLLEEGMEALQIAVSLGHALRKEHKLKVRQPLSAAHIVILNPPLLAFLQQEKHLIEDELNVKTVILHGEKRDFVKCSVKPHFPTLGKKAGAKLKEVQQRIALLTQEEIATLQEGKTIDLLIAGHPFPLTSEDVLIEHIAHEGWAAMHAGGITIALETTLTEELILEGHARELVNKINTMRKEARLDVSDRIRLHIVTTPPIQKALSLHRSYITEEVLALELLFEHAPHAQEWDINGEIASIGIEKISSFE